MNSSNRSKEFEVEIGNVKHLFLSEKDLFYLEEDSSKLICFDLDKRKILWKMQNLINVDGRNIFFSDSPRCRWSFEQYWSKDTLYCASRLNSVKRSICTVLFLCPFRCRWSPTNGSIYPESVLVLGKGLSLLHNKQPKNSSNPPDAKPGSIWAGRGWHGGN